MASKGVSARAAARKQRDKWKSKRWYTIRAPRNPWQFKVIGETLGEAPELLQGRIYEIIQSEIDSSDLSRMFVKLRFRVTEVIGDDALTEYIGHAFENGHVRRQVRRYRGKIDDVIDCVTADGYYIRIKTTLVTAHRVKSSQKSEIRKLARDSFLQTAARSNWVEMQKALLGDDLSNQIVAAVRPIQQIRVAMIRKVQLLQSGVVVDDGPTLEEIREEEVRKAADLKAKKEAALAAAAAGEDAEDDDAAPNVLAAAEVEAEAEAEAALEAEVEAEAEASEAPSEGEPEDSSEDLSSLTVVELKERLKAAGKPVSGKKADLITRLQE